MYGSLSGKLVKDTVAPLAPFVEKAVLVKPDSPRAMPLSELRRIFSRLGIPHESGDSVPDALALAKKLSSVRAGHLQTANCTMQTPLPIVVAGSFYLAGEALRMLRP